MTEFKTCTDCGAEFKKSPRDYTVRCPSCRRARQYELLKEIRERVAAILEIPAWAVDCSWSTREPIVYVKASSGSTLATVNTEARTIRLSRKLEARHGLNHTL